MTRVVIVGRGDHAHALTHLYSNYNCETSGNTLEVTKQNAKKGEVFHRTGVRLSDFHEALGRAHVIVLAIPSASLKRFIFENLDSIRGKIIVDVTNSKIPGEDVNSILGATNIPFVKAFNDIGAVELLVNKPTGKTKIQTKMCSKYPRAMQTVRRFAETSLGMSVKVIPYAHYSALETHQNAFGENWARATFIMCAIFITTEAYCIIRNILLSHTEWSHVPLQITNKAVCWTAIWGFSLSMLPGTLARLLSFIQHKSLRNKPYWLCRFLEMRKHIGLLSLWFLVLHIIISLTLLSPAYYFWLYETNSSDSAMNVIGETSLLFGVLGAGLYLILGACSLPSVKSEMTSKQWQIVFGPLAWSALVCSVLHAMVMGVKTWHYPGLPGNSLLSALIPLITIALKMTQAIISRLACLHQPKMNEEQGLPAHGKESSVEPYTSTVVSYGGHIDSELQSNVFCKESYYEIRSEERASSKKKRKKSIRSVPSSSCRSPQAPGLMVPHADNIEIPPSDHCFEELKSHENLTEQLNRYLHQQRPANTIAPT